MGIEKEYILGTEKAELHRLGLQHQVWSEEARRAWNKAEFSMGQTILDLGSGPGFCSMELGYIVGDSGKVIAVDQSRTFIDFLKNQAAAHGLNIDARCTSFDEMKLIDYSLDGVFSRWALAWIDNPEEIIDKIAAAMAPGAVFVAHEYYDWQTLQSEPSLPNIKKGIKACFKSFSQSDGDINIGKKLPGMLFDAGLEVLSIRPMTKIAVPDELTWEWPKTFFTNYFAKLIPVYLSEKEYEDILLDIEELEDMDGSSILCPTMVEVIAVKP